MQMQKKNAERDLTWIDDGQCDWKVVFEGVAGEKGTP